MKKYFILGTIIVLAALMLSFTVKQDSIADNKPPAFCGTVKQGVTVSACLQSPPYRCFYGVGNQNNRYCISIPSIYAGWYFVTNGCTGTTAYWNGSTTTTVDFCVPMPPLECPCN
jgi:hypothetical protein